MSDKFPPIDNQRRRFQSLQSLLRSEEFINAGELAGKTSDSVTFSFPDLNSSLQHPANTEISSSEVGESGATLDPPLTLEDVSPALHVGPLPAQSTRGMESDLKYRPVDWIPGRETRADPRFESSCCFKVMAAGSDELDPVTVQIENRFSTGTVSVILFASADRYSDSQFITAAVAVKLASRSLKRVLVIDSDFETRQLSAMQGMDSCLGISDWIQTTPSEIAAQHTDHNRLDFVPAGTMSIDCLLSAGEKLNHYLKYFSTSHSFIFVNAGDAHSEAVQIWSQYCGGSYLAINKKRSSRSIAESAVRHMRVCESRLIGCVMH
ncbi:MAG: hypothetical protein MK106_07755 [Mariniblastus sp.]|nr:hypothetical protein [Mariniblastus sp.]